MDNFAPQEPQNRKEYAFSLSNGQYRFLIAIDDSVRIFILTHDEKECLLHLSFLEYQKMTDNLMSLSKFF